MRARRGVTLIELMAAVVILMVVLVAAAAFQTAAFKNNQKERDRSIAMQKAVQMMEEVVARSARYPDDLVLGVDPLGNKVGEYSFKLTTDEHVTDDAAGYTAPLSGNKPYNEGFRYVRQIAIDVPPEDDRARRVTVTVFFGDGKDKPNRKLGAAPLASLTNVVKATRSRMPTSQVYDLYLVNIENLPGWWAEVGTLERMVDESIKDLQKTNEGLRFRKHWIRRLSYGRDPYYRPIINGQAHYQDPAAVPLNSVYVYPGLGLKGFHYKPGVMRGQMTLDGADYYKLSEGNTAGHYNERQVAYAYADQFNHALRLPEERAKHPATDEPTLRLLLEDMIAGNLKNALVLNLHSELFPMPPLRNYADAAHVPAVKSTSEAASRWGVAGISNPNDVVASAHARLVTHPRKLRYNTNELVELDVYPYMTDPSRPLPHPEYRKGQIVLRGVASALKPFGSTLDSIEVLALDANYAWQRVWPSSGAAPDASFTAPFAVADGSGVSTTYLPGGLTEVTGTEAAKDRDVGDIVIPLGNIAYDHPVNASNRGLHSAQHLHGMNYQPNPALPTLEAAWSGASGEARNTARFKIRFQLKDATELQVLTTIGDVEELQRHQYPNRSNTYVWVGLDVPETEKYQFQGDPRHYPYLDADRANHPTYNRYFGAFTSLPGPAALPKTRRGWENGSTAPDVAGDRNDVDLPSYFAVWRKALAGANAVLAMPAGLSFGYVGLGGEVEADDGGLSAKPFTGLAGAEEIFTISGASRLPARADGSWYAKPWLGELVPDTEDAWTDWRNDGNLPSADYRQLPHTAIAAWPAGPDIKFNRTRYVGAKGGAAFFNGGASGAWFAHQHDPGANAARSVHGQHFSDFFKLGLPAGAPFQFPFSLADTDTARRPPDWADFTPHVSVESGLSPSGYYVGGSGNEAFAPLLFREGGKTGYVVVSGASSVADTGVELAGPITIAGALQGFFDLANPSYLSGGDKGSETIRLLPRIQITAPAEDTRLTGGSEAITWTAPEWTRWDQDVYSKQWSGYQLDPDRPPMVYNVKYSENGGVSWLFLDGSPALPGVYDDTQKITVEATTWNYAGLTRGEYLLRVEAYRDLPQYLDTHYAFHQVAYKLSP